MKLHIKYDINALCKKIIEEQLEKQQVAYKIIGFGEVDLTEAVPDVKMKQLINELKNYGIEIVENQKSILVQKIKDAITEMIYMEDKLPTSKISSYLADKLNHSYGYISNLFSDVTYTSIENYIIIQRIERAKQLLLADELTCSEIGWKLNYSSIAHFSAQFKNVTGLTPTSFQRIINKRRNNAINNNS